MTAPVPNVGFYLGGGATTAGDRAVTVVSVTVEAAPVVVTITPAGITLEAP